MLVTDTKVEASLPSLVERLKPNTELLLEVSVETKLDKANLNQEGLSQVVCEQAYEKDKLTSVDHTKPSMVELSVFSEEHNTASGDFPETGGDKANCGGELVVSADALTNQECPGQRLLRTSPSRPTL